MSINRRRFLQLSSLPLGCALPALSFAQEKSKLKITGVRLVSPKPNHPVLEYTPAAGSWEVGGHVASPMSLYPEYRARRSLFLPDAGKMQGFTVEISTDKGVTGYGQGGTLGGEVVEQHFVKFLIGQDPFNIEKIWDILWKSSIYYDRAGIATHAISGVDLALWDLVGKALGMPVYKLLGGETKDRIPAYCTGNDIDQHLKFGFKRLKLAMPYGPAEGIEGMRKNYDLVKDTRNALGPDGDIMLDCWMAWNEQYTLEMAEMLAPLRIYWMEEVLPPYDFEGFGRLSSKIKTTRLAAGEHEYTRYDFRRLADNKAASIWQPDIHWCGGMTEIRRIAALAAAYDIPVIPHVGGTADCTHFLMATVNCPWAELFLPQPGGPPEVYQRFEEELNITRGPEGIYVRPSDKPGLGWDFHV